MDSPFVGRYLIRNRKANMVMHIIDNILTCCRIRTKRHFNIPKPKKLLITNIAQIGDVVMTTALLPVIRKALPDCEIGMVVGRWAKPLVHDLVDHLHFYDHWKLTKKKSDFSSVVKELRDEAYDVSIDCCYYFPNTHFLTARAKIPVRIGYTSGGFGPLLTHPVQYTNRLQSASEHFAALLSLVTPIDHTLLEPLLKVKSNPIKGDYLVIHMGSGNRIKEWPVEKWRAVAKSLPYRLLFTGRGEKETKEIAEVTKGLEHCIDLSNKLSLEECVAVINGAKLLIGVDTGVGHIAAATKTPSVLIYSGINPIEHWSPKSSLAQIVINKPACYPCYRMNGCETMECVRSITVEQLLQKIHASLDQRKESDHQSQDHSAVSPCAAHEI